MVECHIGYSESFAIGQHPWSRHGILKTCHTKSDQVTVGKPQPLNCKPQIILSRRIDKIGCTPGSAGPRNRQLMLGSLIADH